ncbi:MAG: hypothetical protein EOP82_18550 [Variovorax sp.]|nr:MAG: hypothetical protein EOP82_18550 [Variovorax sp.]
MARVKLAPDWGSGRIEQRLHDARLKYPMTAAVSPAGLMIVNSQLDRQKNPPALLPFDVCDGRTAALTATPPARRDFSNNPCITRRYLWDRSGAAKLPT